MLQIYKNIKTIFIGFIRSLLKTFQRKRLNTASRLKIVKKVAIFYKKYNCVLIECCNFVGF